MMQSRFACCQRNAPLKISPERGVVDVQVADVLQSNRSVASINVYRRDDNSPQSVEMEGV